MNRFRGITLFVGVMTFLVLAPTPVVGSEGGSKSKIDAPDKKKEERLSIQVELLRAEPVSCIRIYINNPKDAEFSFATGAWGGPGSLDDGFRLDPKQGPPRPFKGTFPTIVPEVNFRRPSGNMVTVRPPRVWMKKQRGDGPGFQKVKPHERFLYANFAVPNHLISGEFAGAMLRLRSGILRTGEITELVIPEESEEGDSQ